VKSFSLEKVKDITKAMREDSFTFTAARRICIPKPGKGKETARNPGIKGQTGTRSHKDDP